MPKKKVVKKSVKKSKKEDDTKMFAFLATFLSIVGFVIALLVKKDDKYVMHYAKQSLMVFFVFVAGWAVMLIPIIGTFIIGPVVQIVGLVLWVISWIYSLSGKEKIVPIVGQYADRIEI
ncbi:MAG: hypothetical protein ABIB79_02010 [archaeon]